MRFPVLYADPPWSFRTWSDKAQRSAKKHYPVMSIEAIGALPVASIAAPSSALFLWVTTPNLKEGIATGEAWGFTYKACAFVWAKHNALRDGNGEICDDANWFMGMGYYTRANAEICLLFTRGNPLERQSKNVRQLLIAGRGRHSAKPVEAYRRIERLFCGPYVELFARQRRAGWTSLGNEIDGKDITDALRELAQIDPD